MVNDPDFVRMEVAKAIYETVARYTESILGTKTIRMTTWDEEQNKERWLLQADAAINALRACDEAIDTEDVIDINRNNFQIITDTPDGLKTVDAWGNIIEQETS